MNLSERIIDIVHRWRSSSPRRRWPVSLVVMLCFVVGNIALVWSALWIDRRLGIRVTGFEELRYALGWPICVMGSLLMLWIVFLFFRQRGTPVPLNPPKSLITSGPYRVTRNPMISGWFIGSFGLAIVLGSIVQFFVVTPLLMLPFILFVIKVEEPELEKRFGQEYLNYKNSVPRFFPRLRPRRTESSS
ncbi:MAG: isoprenylcysteine carboxylmethyltransferase family protein [candidate division Zixibacteria bacterium]|nr:isoprenylcysteine carboxylmethyltransferase family protein [candidate division Zixibacteria bacterium]MDH3935867.1 isoprenylcysteine carboxylmethyltransferase family protein [candidate division Zixibacteria bacterium]MDH4032897.1 isoprenylcysteine carboxylmethyltransferase family protein [candidate division Zixibacteria bacterium]